VTAAHDFDEMVDLLALSRPVERAGGSAMACKIATLPLRDAVALVVEEWADDKFRQLSAVIVRRSGPAIDPALAARKRRLELARADVERRLATASAEAHRQMLERALRALDDDIAALG